MDTPHNASNEAPSGDTAAWAELLTRQHAAPLIMVCMGVRLHAADSLLVAIMMPAIVDDIGGTRQIFRTVVLYEIGSIVAGVSSGLLTGRHGCERGGN